MDEFEREVLRAVWNRLDASTAEALRADVPNSSRSIEAVLFELEREGLVEQDPGEVAHYHSPEVSPPPAKRYWKITQKGRDALKA